MSIPSPGRTNAKIDADARRGPKVKIGFLWGARPGRCPAQLARLQSAVTTRSGRPGFRPFRTIYSQNPRHTFDTATKGGPHVLKIGRLGWWPGTELNRRRQPFQGCALPTELPGLEPQSEFFDCNTGRQSSTYFSVLAIAALSRNPSALRRHAHSRMRPITISPADKPIHNPTAPSDSRKHKNAPNGKPSIQYPAK